MKEERGGERVDEGKKIIGKEEGRKEKVKGGRNNIRGYKGRRKWGGAKGRRREDNYRKGGRKEGEGKGRKK